MGGDDERKRAVAQPLIGPTLNPSVWDVLSRPGAVDPDTLSTAVSKAYREFSQMFQEAERETYYGPGRVLDDTVTRQLSRVRIRHAISNGCIVTAVDEETGVKEHLLFFKTRHQRSNEWHRRMVEVDGGSLWFATRASAHYVGVTYILTVSLDRPLSLTMADTEKPIPADRLAPTMTNPTTRERVDVTVDIGMGTPWTGPIVADMPVAQLEQSMRVHRWQVLGLAPEREDGYADPASWVHIRALNPELRLLDYVEHGSLAPLRLKLYPRALLHAMHAQHVSDDEISTGLH